jgi:hypothetical protein
MSNDSMTTDYDCAKLLLLRVSPTKFLRKADDVRWYVQIRGQRQMSKFRVRVLNFVFCVYFVSVLLAFWDSISPFFQSWFWLGVMGDV